MIVYNFFSCEFQAVNKLAEIMNRREFSNKPGKKVNASELRKKEKDCRKLQQELNQVGTAEMFSPVPTCPVLNCLVPTCQVCMRAVPTCPVPNYPILICPESPLVRSPLVNCNSPIVSALSRHYV